MCRPSCCFLGMSVIVVLNLTTDMVAVSSAEGLRGQAGQLQFPVLCGCVCGLHLRVPLGVFLRWPTLRHLPALARLGAGWQGYQLQSHRLVRSCAEVFNRTITPAVIVRGQAGRLFGKGPLQISCQEFVLQACRVINDDSLRRDRTKVVGMQAVQMAMMDWRLEQVPHSKVYRLWIAYLWDGNSGVISGQPRTAAEIEADYQNFIQQWRQPPLGQGAAWA